MKMKKVGKMAVLLGATVALVATLINDNKRKEALKELEESEN